MLKDSFLIEIEKQCKFGIVASYDLENALKSHNMDRLWYSVQGILLAPGNISKLLWPSNTQSADRGNELRTMRATFFETLTQQVEASRFVEIHTILDASFRKLLACGSELLKKLSRRGIPGLDVTYT